jgi:hypothetical protein
VQTNDNDMQGLADTTAAEQAAIESVLPGGTQGRDLPPCTANVFRNGVVLAVAVTPHPDVIERWVEYVRGVTGQPVDWHFAAGRAIVKALGETRLVLEHLRVGEPRVEGFQVMYPEPDMHGNYQGGPTFPDVYTSKARADTSPAALKAAAAALHQRAGMPAADAMAGLDQPERQHKVALVPLSDIKHSHAFVLPTDITGGDPPVYIKGHCYGSRAETFDLRGRKRVMMDKDVDVVRVAIVSMLVEYLDSVPIEPAAGGEAGGTTHPEG